MSTTGSQLGRLIIAHGLKTFSKGGVNMKLVESDLERPSFWQLVFSQSKVNGALYNDEELPGQNWNWPKDTYLQRRLRQTRWYRAADRADLSY